MERDVVFIYGLINLDHVFFIDFIDFSLISATCASKLLLEKKKIFQKKGHPTRVQSRKKTLRFRVFATIKTC